MTKYSSTNSDLSNVKMFTPMKFLIAKMDLKSARILKKSNLRLNNVIAEIKYFCTLFMVRPQILYSRYIVNPSILGKFTLEGLPQGFVGYNCLK